MPQLNETHSADGAGAELGQWTDATRIVLQPIAAPSILGLFAFTAATFMVSTNIVGWYGSTTTSPAYLFEFAAVFGGIAQFAAGMWAYRARDAVATAVHGMWGPFWIAYGLLQLLNATGAITLPAGKFPELAFWFFPLAAITASAAVASIAHSLAITATLCVLSAGAALVGVGYLTGDSGWLHAGGWVLFASSLCAFYVATATMWAASLGRVVLPLGEPRAVANLPGRTLTHPIEYRAGEPGVRQGQ